MSMSNDVFPDLPGLAWGVVKTPVWKTRVLTTASDREERGTFVSYPRWKITLKFEFLREWAGKTEFSTICGFFNQRGGSFESFLFRDPEDYLVTNQVLGISDGVKVEYRFVRALGGFVEPVLAPNVQDSWVYLDKGTALGKWRISDASRTNIARRSEDLTNANWTKTGVTITGDATASPDGVSDADLITENSANSEHSVYATHTSVADTKHVISTHVKANGRTIGDLVSLWPGAGGAEFDLTANTVSLGANVLSAGIRELTNGWHRVWIVVRPTSVSGNSQRLRMKTTQGGSTVYTGDGTSGMYNTWWQIETIGEDDPEEPTEYIPSTGGAATTVPADFTRDTYGYFQLTTVPVAGTEISWSGSFYFRVRFTHDAADFERFMKQLYSAKKIEFISEK